MDGIGGDSFSPGQAFSPEPVQVPIVSDGAAHSSLIVNSLGKTQAHESSNLAAKEPNSSLAALTYSALHGGHPPDVALGQIANGIHSELSGIYATVFFGGASTVTCRLPGTPVFCCKDQSTSAAHWSQSLRQVAGDAIGQRRFVSNVIRSGDVTLMAVANPVMVNGEVAGVFGLVGEASSARELAQAINVVGGAVAHWWKTESQQQPAQAESAADDTANRTDNTSSFSTSTSTSTSTATTTATLLDKVVSQPCLNSATQTVAHQLCSEFDFETVFIGRGERGGASRLLAISNTTKFSPKSPLTTAVEEVLSEAIIRDEFAVANVRQGGEAVTSGCRSLAGLCNQPLIVSGPLRGARGAWGAWIGVGASFPNQRAAAKMNADTNSVGPCLQLFDRARGGRLATLMTGFCDRLKTKKGMLILLLLSSFAMLVPMPYRVKCDSELQPVTRRFIPVPYDGVLKEVFVEPGDEISNGQVLAKMDGREIEWELAALEADYSQAAKKHDSDMASRDTAAAQVAKLEMDRLRVQIKLLKDRANKLDVKSPIDGVIIGGDPKKKVGARLAQGDSLFEAGPLSNMVAEIYVPDDEVSRVAVGQKVGLRLDAFPSDKWTGKLLRISPSAEVHASENVFVAQFEIENPRHTLRPGMRGRSRISTTMRPLGWNLFHKAWEQLVYGWGW